MIYPFQRADVVAIKYDLPLQLLPVLLDVVVLHHDHHHIHLVQELVEVQDLVLHDRLLREERVEGLQRPGQVTLLDVQHLQGRALADVIHVLLVGQAVQAHAAVVRDVMRFHDLVDALQHEHRLVVVGLHALVDHLGQLRIVSDQEPGIHADAVATHAGAGLQDVHARVHIADPDDLVYIHIVVTADTAQLVCKCNVHGTVGVLDHLGHLCRTDVRHHDLSLAERCIVALHLLANLLAVCANRAVVVQQFVNHVAGDDALGGVDQVEVLPDLESSLLDDGADVSVDRAGTDRGFDDDGGAFRADAHHFLDGGDHVAGIDFLAEFVVGRGDGDDVGVGLLVLRGELDAGFDGGLEELVQSFLLEGGLAGVQGGDEFFVVVGADDFHAVGGHHKGSRQADIAQSNYIYHIIN